MTGKLYDRDQAADRLNVSRMTVRRLGASGDLDEIRVDGRNIRITEESIERHIAARRVLHGSRSAAA